MLRQDRIVILGASHAGVTVAAELRSAGHEGEIILCGDEPALPYQRPHLSKECLGPESPEPRALRPESFYADKGVTLRQPLRADAIDRAAGKLHFAGGKVLGYDRLILATGAEARRLPQEIDPDGRALRLRSYIDWKTLSKRLQPGRRLCVIGGGLIGLEVAVVALARGCAVSLVEAAPRLMARSLYPELAAVVEARHRAAGLDIRLDTRVAVVSDAGVNLEGGELVAADVVLSAIGASPSISLAQAAGLSCSDGIEVDAVGATSDPGVFALGDCAFWHADGSAMRHENIAATQAQAKAVAAGMLGLPTPAAAPLRLWSTQGALRLQMAGAVLANARVEMEELDGGAVGEGPDAPKLLRATCEGRLVAVQALDAPRPFAAALGGLEEIVNKARCA